MVFGPMDLLILTASPAQCSPSVVARCNQSVRYVTSHELCGPNPPLAKKLVPITRIAHHKSFKRRVQSTVTETGSDFSRHRRSNVSQVDTSDQSWSLQFTHFAPNDFKMRAQWSTSFLRGPRHGRRFPCRWCSQLSANQTHNPHHV